MLHLRMVRTKARDSYSAKLCPLTEFRSCSLAFRRRIRCVRKKLHDRKSVMGPDCVKTTHQRYDSPAIWPEDSMTRFVVGDDRSQSTLFPERLDDYFSEDNPVRAVDVFVDELDLAGLGFGGVEPEATGRPAYHPATLLKIYVYGYLNRVQSSRRLERECQRNIELVWLTGRLMPDFKTIADFRKDNGEAIRKVCREFVVLCRRLELFSEASVAIDGSKFKAVNTRDRNFTQAKMHRRLAQIDESIARYLSQLDSADRQGDSVPEAKITRLNEKIATLRQEIQRLNGLNTLMMQTEDKQISLTDPDARSMATSGRGSGMVGYNVQSAVDTKHHLIVAHEVTNVGSDRSELSRMSEQARAAIGSETIEAVADRGYYSGEEIVACEQAGITVYLPKPMTSGLYAKGRYGLAKKELNPESLSVAQG